MLSQGVDAVGSGMKSIDREVKRYAGKSLHEGPKEVVSVVYGAR